MIRGVALMKNELLRKIKNKELTAGVVGLGYVGLPLAVEKEKRDLKPWVLTFRRARSIWSTPDTII